MIKSINYSFSQSENNPYIIIDIEWIWKEKDYSDPYLLNTELNQLTWEYVRQIVKELEEVKEWKKDMISFWFETTSIIVLKKWYIDAYWKNYPKGLVYITYNYWDNELDTNLTIEDILTMMTKWRDYINKWEKETGKIKR